MQTRVVVLCAVLLLLAGSLSQADQFVDDFEESIDFLADGIGTSGWDGFLGLGVDETADALNASMTNAGQLYMESTNGRYQEPWTPLGPFLYKMVGGDFIASVHVADYQDVLHNNGGIMARALPDDAGNGEDWVSIDYFPIWSCGNFVRSANNGARTENGHNGLAFGLDPYLQLERVGNTFYFRTSVDGVSWTEMAQSPLVRDDMDGLALQVGLFQATYNTTTGYVVYDDFVLEGENVASKSGKGSYKPVPKNEATDVEYGTTLSWTRGLVGESYNVYFGDDFDAVDSATVPDSQEQRVNSFYPGALAFGTTYYWRVDDVNGTPDRTVFKGKVWSFTVEPYSIMIPVDINKATASSNVKKNTPDMTVNGSGLEGGVHSDNQSDMWLSAAVDLSPWLMYEFDKVQKLDQMLIWNSNSGSDPFIGWGLRDVNIVYSSDGVNWTSLADSIEISKAPGLPTYNEPQVIDFGLAQARYVKINILSNWGGFLKQYGVSEVQFYGLPVYVRTVQPEDGSTDVDPGTILSWRGGRGASSHEIYISEDVNAVAEGSALVATVEGDSYDLAAFDPQLGNTYYWKVNAVSDMAYEGDILSFTTAEPLMVDDFEGYTNFSPDRPFQTWLDGFGYSADEFFPVEYVGNGTGSGVGHDIWNGSSPYFEGKIMEGTVVKKGRWSLPFYYKNTGGVASQIDRKWSDPQDWNAHGIETLVLFISGNPANTGTSLYVKINGQKITCPKSNVLQSSLWTQWNIDLTTLNVNSVNTLSLGVDGAGSGVLYLDDFGLYRNTPEAVVSVDPGVEGLAAKYSLDSNLEDTSGKGLGAGTAIGGPFFVDGRIGNGKALSFNGLDDYVTLPIGGVIASAHSITITCWADFSNEGGAWQRLWDFGSGLGTNPYIFLCPRVNTAGPVRFVIGPTGDESLVESRNTLASGWQHVTAVIDGDTRIMTLYVNGAVVAEGTTQVIPSDLGVTTQNYLAKSQYPDALYQGSIDELMIYTRVLSEGEIRYLAGDK